MKTLEVFTIRHTSFSPLILAIAVDSSTFWALCTLSFYYSELFYLRVIIYVHVLAVLVNVRCLDDIYEAS
jgi:hypothetical protein